MDARLNNLVCESIAAFCEVSRDQIGSLTVEKICNAGGRVYRLVPQLKDWSFALKFRGITAVKHGEVHGDTTTDEFERIKRAWSAIRTVGGDIGMPAPVALYPDYRAILTTWCDGQELRKRYYANAWRWRFPNELLCGHFRRSGEWLGQFHNASRYSANADETMENRLNHVERMLEAISASPRNRLGTADLFRVRKAIRGCLTASKQTEFGLLHGNFTLRNILVSATGVTPVDFEGSREDAIDMDTGQFVADVILSTCRPHVRSAAGRSLVREFVAAYGRHGHLDVERVRGFAIYHMLAAYYDEVTGRRSLLSASVRASSHQARIVGKMLATPRGAVEAYL